MRRGDSEGWWVEVGGWKVGVIDDFAAGSVSAVVAKGLLAPAADVLSRTIQGR